jgi:SAM-dependent methyltransferase
MSTRTSDASPTFDAEKYKATTREQWQAAAEPWHRWGPFIEDWLGDATDVMLDLAGVTSGSDVLDIAAGAGGQSIAAARRVGPDGTVLATDIAPAILEHAASDARALGLTQIRTQVVDGEELDIAGESFDAVISRVGLIYFPDQQAALAGVWRSLRPGGRLAAVVYSSPDRNGFFSIPVGIIRRRANLPAPGPGQPGPFSLAAPGAIEDAFAIAGFTEIVTASVESPLRLPSAAECVRFERESFGALHQMLAGLDAAEQDDTWAEIEVALRAFEDGDAGTFLGPCEMLVAAGTKAR